MVDSEFRIFDILKFVIGSITFFKVIRWLLRFLKTDKTRLEIKFSDEIVIDFDENIKFFGQTLDRSAPLSTEEIERQIRLYGFVDKYEENVRDVFTKMTVKFNYNNSNFELSKNLKIDQINLRMALYQQEVLKVFVANSTEDKIDKKTKRYQEIEVDTFFIDLTALSLGFVRLS